MTIETIVQPQPFADAMRDLFRPVVRSSREERWVSLDGEATEVG